MLELLQIARLHDGWGELFYQVMKTHRSLQKDREQAEGATIRAENAKKEMFNEEGDNARKRLFELQSELYVQYVNMVIPTLDKDYDSTKGSKSTSNKKKSMDKLCDEIVKVAKIEEERLGKNVIQTCLNKYKAFKERWTFIISLQNIPDDQIRIHQPSITQFSGSFLRSTNVEDHLQDRLKHLIVMSNFFHSFFEQQMKTVIENVNNAENIQALGLDYNTFFLPFNDDMQVNENKRANLTIGPIKRVDRALEKAKEYGELLNVIFMFIPF